MSYITKRPEGAPSWLPPAVLCRVRNSTDDEWQNDYINNYLVTSATDDKPFRGDDGDWWRYAEPIEDWQPSEGEIVAAWSTISDWFIIVKHFQVTEHQHVARLVYPDGRVIDCACDVEELKRRVGDGNWL